MFLMTISLTTLTAVIDLTSYLEGKEEIWRSSSSDFLSDGAISKTISINAPIEAWFVDSIPLFASPDIPRALRLEFAELSLCRNGNIGKTLSI